PQVGQPAVHRGQQRTRQPGARGHHLRRGLSQLPPQLRARLSQRRALVAVGSDQVADRGPAAVRPDPAPEAHAGVPDPARPARHAVHAGPRAAGEDPGCGPLAHRTAARAPGARVRQLPRRSGRLGARQGAVARREEARSAGAVGAGGPAEQTAGDRAAPLPAAAAHAHAAGAARVVELADAGCARLGRPAHRLNQTRRQKARLLPAKKSRATAALSASHPFVCLRLARPVLLVHHARVGRIFEVRKHTMFARWNRMAKQFARIAKDITMAVKACGTDPASNPVLRRTIQNARTVNMPKDRIEAAIKRAAGRDAANYPQVLYEAYAP